MSYMFEVYYQIPPDPQKETELTTQMSRFGGHLTFREPPGEYGSASVCLTYEFDELSLAEALRRQGEYVEGPVDYGS